MIRLGTRRSALATAQATLVADQLRALGHEVEMVPITTTGDVNRAPLEQIGRTGIFVSTLRDALLSGQIDIAAHSLKDLPTQPIDGLTLGARPDPRRRPGRPGPHLQPRSQRPAGRRSGGAASHREVRPGGVGPCTCLSTR